MLVTVHTPGRDFEVSGDTCVENGRFQLHGNSAPETSVEFIHTVARAIAHYQVLDLSDGGIALIERKRVVGFSVAPES